MTENRLTWYFTFGFDNLHPRTRAPLGRHYTTTYGTYSEAREKIIAIFGSEWAFQYPSADKAGVDRYNLTYVPCVECSPGELLPPSPHEMKIGKWALETVTVFEFTGVSQAFIHPYYPTFDELSRAFRRYNVPQTATIEYGECGSHTIVVKWAV